MPRHRVILLAICAAACASARSAPAAARAPGASPAGVQLIARMYMIESYWSTPIVPRMSADGDPLAPLAAPESLLSSRPTYVNWATYKNPAVCGSWTDQLYLDYQPISTIRRSNCQWLSMSFPAVNDGPFVVRGGRHQLSGQPDVYREVCDDPSFPPEGWWAQWVWSPMPTAKESPFTSSQPPPANGAYLNFSQPCADGFEVKRANAYAWVVAAVASDPAKNHDLIVYSDPWTGGNTGFSQVLRRSSQAAGHVDFVVGTSGSALPAVFPAVVRKSDADSSGYTLDWSDAARRRDATAEARWSGALGPNRLADVYEVWLGAGAHVRMNLTRTSGSNALGAAVFPPGPDSAWTRAGAIATGATYQADANDTLAVTATRSGWYPVVVYRDGPPAAGETSGYVLAVGSAALLGVPAGPTRLFFAGAVPNPVRVGARFEYGLAAAGPVRLALYDIGGRLVRTLVDGEQAVGRRTVAWDLRDAGGARVGAGVYWARFEAAGTTLARRVVVAR